MDALLRTKLFISRRRANLVPRPRLVERLNTGLDKKHPLSTTSSDQDRKYKCFPQLNPSKAN
jgi:hypothetical protein